MVLPAGSFALENQPMQPETYRLAFWLFGRVRLVQQALEREHGTYAGRGEKRTSRPSDMISTMGARERCTGLLGRPASRRP